MCQVFSTLVFSLLFNSQTTLLNPHDTSDKRPKLERARSAAEKENHPLQRTGSQLRRQYSQQETSTRRTSASASDSGVDDNYLQRNHLHSQHQTGVGGSGSNVDSQYINQSPQYRNQSGNYYQGSGGGYSQDNDPRYYQVRTNFLSTGNKLTSFLSFQG